MAGENGHAKPSWGFVGLLAVWEVIMIILFGACATYSSEAGGGPLTDENQAAVNKFSPVFMDVHVMIFIGFGYLMVFLRRHGFSSLGYTFLISAFVIQWYLLNDGFWHGVFHAHFEKIGLSVEHLIRADFCAGAVMITYGVVLGKVSPIQLVVISLVEVVLFAVNEQIGLALQIADIGGSMVIHMFGAAFGLALSVLLVKPKAFGHKHNGPVYHSDLFAMIGTVFLWLYWPSFNSALGKANTQHRAEINTVIGLTASCVMTFVVSHLLRHDHKFCMVDIQNATLAGGVAMGTAADMLIGPGPAFFIGAFAGVVSSLGFRHLLPALEEKLQLHDTCGVANLHFLPSLIGAVAGAIAAAVATREDYGEQLETVFPARTLNVDGSDARTASYQAGMQALYILITLGISIFGGLLTGLVVKHISPLEAEHELFNDEVHWEVPAEEGSVGLLSKDDRQVSALEVRIRTLEAALTGATSTRTSAGWTESAQGQHSARKKPVIVHSEQKQASPPAQASTTNKTAHDPDEVQPFVVTHDTAAPDMASENV